MHESLAIAGLDHYLRFGDLLSHRLDLGTTRIQAPVTQRGTLIEHLGRGWLPAFRTGWHDSPGGFRQKSVSPWQGGARRFSGRPQPSAERAELPPDLQRQAVTEAVEELLLVVHLAQPRIPINLEQRGDLTLA